MKPRNNSEDGSWQRTTSEKLHFISEMKYHASWKYRPGLDLYAYRRSTLLHQDNLTLDMVYGDGMQVAQVSGYDQATGLYLMGARYYDPVLQRFVTADSYSGDVDVPLSLNRYAYVGDDPVSYIDPTGHSWWNSWDGFLEVVRDSSTGISQALQVLSSVTTNTVQASENAASDVTAVGTSVSPVITVVVQSTYRWVTNIAPLRVAGAWLVVADLAVSTGLVIVGTFVVAAPATLAAGTVFGGPGVGFAAASFVSLSGSFTAAELATATIRAETYTIESGSGANPEGAAEAGSEGLLAALEEATHLLG